MCMVKHTPSFYIVVRVVAFTGHPSHHVNHEINEPWRKKKKKKTRGRDVICQHLFSVNTFNVTRHWISEMLSCVIMMGWSLCIRVWTSVRAFIQDWFIFQHLTPARNCHLHIHTHFSRKHKKGLSWRDRKTAPSTFFFLKKKPKNTKKLYISILTLCGRLWSYI